MRILLLTYHFRPEKHAGADRPNSLHKYARENGVEMDVVTATAAGAPAQESGIRRFDAIAGWNKAGQVLRKAPWKLLTKLAEPLAFNADFYWCNAVCRSLQNEVRKKHDAIYVVFPKFSALVAGYRLSREAGIPLVVDFTDAIMCDPLDPLNPIQKRFQLGFESKVMRSARAVITIAKGMETDLRHRYGKKRILNVYNGFDPDDFAGLALNPFKRTDKKPIRIIHFGNIGTSRKRSIAPLIEGLRLVAGRTENLAAQISISFVGKFDANEQNQFQELRDRGIVRFLPYMEKHEGFRMIREEGDFLLLYGTPGQPSTVTSKLLEYLKLGKPILGICKGNEAESIIARAGAGECAEFSGLSVASLITKAMNQTVAFRPDLQYIEGFSRQKQAKEIFDFLRTILK